MPKKTKEEPDTPGRVSKTKREWVLAALEALVEGGIDAVKVERLAPRLGVSKGSFYWHFKDRADLLGALLDLWDADMTHQLIENAARLPSPDARVRAVAAQALERTMHGIDAARAEAAAQAWAAHDDMAAARLRAVDDARVDYLVREFRALGMKGRRATRLARAAYLALLGLYSARAYNSKLADDDAYLELVETILSRAKEA
jgi:AcrR family transcriptional regulator